TRKGIVTAVAISPDGKVFAAGSDGETARLWNLETGEPAGPDLDQSGGISALFLGPHYKTLVTSMDGKSRLWDGSTGKPIGPYLTHKSVVRAASFSPDGQLFVTGADDSSVRLWEARTGKPLGTPWIHPTRVSF